MLNQFSWHHKGPGNFPQSPEDILGGRSEILSLVTNSISNQIIWTDLQIVHPVNMICKSFPLLHVLPVNPPNLMNYISRCPFSANFWPSQDPKPQHTTIIWPSCPLLLVSRAPWNRNLPRGIVTQRLSICLSTAALVSCTCLRILFKPSHVFNLCAAVCLSSTGWRTRCRPDWCLWWWLAGWLTGWPAADNRVTCWWYRFFYRPRFSYGIEISQISRISLCNLDLNPICGQ